MLCKNLITQLQTIQETQVELNQKIGIFSDLKNSPRASQNEWLFSLFNYRKHLRFLIKELRKEFYKPIIETKNYITVEDHPTQEKVIKINFEKILKKTVKFYQKYEINLPHDFEIRAKEIWRTNYDAIKIEIATYGYDHVLIIPDNLPGLAEVHSKMTNGYTDSNQGINFTIDRSFDGLTNSHCKNNTFRLILTHKVSSIVRHELLDNTKDKSPEQLTGLTEDQIESIIEELGELPINIKFNTIKFGPGKETQNRTLKAEGLALVEYLIFQRQYFEDTGRHLDKNLWTWLLSTYSSRSLVAIAWQGDNNRLCLDGGNFHHHGELLGCRPSRSFFLK